MSKNNEYDNLVRKIFIKRKAKEIGIFLLVTGLIVFMPYLIGGCLMHFFPGIITEQPPTEFILVVITWTTGVMFIVVTLIAILILAGLRAWLIDNWEASEKEAKRILKNGKKRKK